MKIEKKLMMKMYVFVNCSEYLRPTNKEKIFHMHSSEIYEEIISGVLVMGLLCVCIYYYS